MSIATNIQDFQKTLPQHVKLVAVSKTKPNADLLQAFEAGQRIFGENKVQEMTAKWEELPKDIEWHMIGHLQSNKVKYLVPYVSLIHAVDRIKLFKEINKQAERFDKHVHVLLQVKIAEEESKFGMDPAEARKLLSEDTLSKYTNLTVKGLMGMASFTEDKEQIKREFTQLKKIYDEFSESHNFTTLSMGMSGDYELAIACGSTMVRVGSAIFGERNYE